MRHRSTRAWHDIRRAARHRPHCGGGEHTFGHDEEPRFKAWARKNRVPGLWAAGLMGKAGASAGACACDIVMADFEKPCNHDMVRTLMQDLAAAGKSTEEYFIRREGERVMAEAMKRMMTT